MYNNNNEKKIQLNVHSNLRTNLSLMFEDGIKMIIKFLILGEAIICYQCNSEYDPRCGDPFDPYSLGTVNCSFQPRLEHLSHLEPTLCRKISQKGDTFSIIQLLDSSQMISIKILQKQMIYSKSH